MSAPDGLPQSWPEPAREPTALPLSVATLETSWEVMRRQGVSRRSFLNLCGLTATTLGLAPTMAGRIARALETKPRIPVLWLHGLECTCCSESFIRSAHPLATDVILSMISLDYDDLTMAAAGHQAEAILHEIRTTHKGRQILGVEENASLNQDGMCCILAGRPCEGQLREMAARTARRSSPGAPAPPTAACKPPGSTRPRRCRCMRSSATSRSSGCRAVRPSPRSRPACCPTC